MGKRVVMEEDLMELRLGLLELKSIVDEDSAQKKIKQLLTLAEEKLLNNNDFRNTLKRMLYNRMTLAKGENPKLSHDLYILYQGLKLGTMKESEVIQKLSEVSK